MFDKVQFRDDVQQILSEAHLPDGNKVVAEGKALAQDITIGRTKFFAKYGVSSEYEYKQQMKKEGRIMYHAHIGLASWDETAEALHELYATLERSGYRLDRYGLCLERGMSLPAYMRDLVPRETGPRLETEEQWAQLGQVVPVQPHTGDFMIGFPNSVENTINALKAGVTTIGNLSQYFAHEAPMWKDDVATSVETVKAIGIMAGKKDQGTILHSYLDDGLPALFNDNATIAGFAILERHIIEDLIGARLGNCYGGVAQTPQLRAAWVFALNDIYDGDACGTMFYGDTVSSGPDLNYNRTVAARYLLWDIMAQLKCPIGTAIMPPPFTEGIRIPSVDEIIEVQMFAREMEKTARDMLKYVDFTECYEIKDRIVTGGRRFYRKALEGLDEAGVDVNDPLQMLHVLKKLGARKIEAAFAVGPEDPNGPNGHRPVYQTDVFRSTNNLTRLIIDSMHQQGIEKVSHPVSVIMASADVHEHALFLMRSVMQEFGVNVIYLGAEQDPDDIAAAYNSSADQNVKGVFVSTHNGGALEYAHQLLDALNEADIDALVFMGGRLNQGKEDEELPVDVTEDIRQLGIIPNAEMADMVRILNDK